MEPPGEGMTRPCRIFGKGIPYCISIEAWAKKPVSRYRVAVFSIFRVFSIGFRKCICGHPLFRGGFFYGVSYGTWIYFPAGYENLQK
jgi:hypothetical protein